MSTQLYRIQVLDPFGIWHTLPRSPKLRSEARADARHIRTDYVGKRLMWYAGAYGCVEGVKIIPVLIDWHAAMVEAAKHTRFAIFCGDPKLSYIWARKAASYAARHLS